MAIYRATGNGYLGKQGFIQRGSEFEYAGIPSKNWMEPLDQDAFNALKKVGYKGDPPPEPPKEEKPSGGKAGKGGEEKAAAGKGRTKSTGDEEVL